MGARTEVAKSNIIFIIGSMGAAILAFVFNVMAANILQPEQFGLFSFTLVVMGFFLVFTDLGISSTITKFTASYLSKNDFGRVRFLLGFFLKVRMLLAAAIAAFMLLLAPQVAAFFGEPSHAAFIRYSAGLLLASVLLDFVNIALGGFKRFKALSALKLFEKTARIIIVLLFVGFAGAAAFGAVAGVAVSALLAGIVGFFVLRGSRSVFSAEPRPMESRLVLNFGFWVMISSTVTAVYSSIDSILISIIRPVVDVGLYGIAATWVSLIAYIVPINASVMYPYFSSFTKGKSLKALDKSIKYALVTAMPLAFIMSAFSGAIVGIFYPPEYAEAGLALSALSFISIPLAISPILMMYLYGTGRPKTHTKIISFVFLAEIVVAYGAISYAGIFGAALATLAMKSLEAFVLIFVIYAAPSRHFNVLYLARPLAASVFIYIIATLLLPVKGLLEMVAYGFALLAAYFVIMLALGGLEKSDIIFPLRWFAGKRERPSGEE